MRYSNKERRTKKKPEASTTLTGSEINELKNNNAQLIRDNQILHTMISKLKVDLRKYKENYRSLEIMLKKMNVEQSSTRPFKGLKNRTIELESKAEAPEEAPYSETFEEIKDEIDRNEKKIIKLTNKKTKKKKIPGYERLYNLSKKKTSLKKKL